MQAENTDETHELSVRFGAQTRPKWSDLASL